MVVGSGTARDCGHIWKTNEVHLYENQGASAQKWLELRLVGDGVGANKSAFGARVTVNAGASRSASAHAAPSTRSHPITLP